MWTASPPATGRDEGEDAVLSPILGVWAARESVTSQVSSGVEKVVYLSDLRL